MNLESKVEALAKRLGCKVSGPCRFLLVEEAGLEVSFYPYSQDPTMVECSAGFTWDDEEAFDAHGNSPEFALEFLCMQINCGVAKDFWRRLVDRVDRDKILSTNGKHQWNLYASLR